MKYFYIIVTCILLSQCRVNKSSPKVFTLKDSICYLDTSYISTKLKHIIISYVHENPQYDNLVLMHNSFVVKSIHKDLDIDELYILGPTFTGESYEKRIYPASYFTINGKIVFINSSIDRLINQKLCEIVYMKHLEIDTSFMGEVKFWLLKIERTGSVSVLTKNPDEYLGVDEVIEPANFTAPVSKKHLMCH